MIAVFYSVGLIDRARLGASGVEIRKAPLFIHTADYFYDGGSIRYDSFVYSAFESRRREVFKDEEGRERSRPGYQGYYWRWKHLNSLWILALIGTSFLIVARRLNTLKEPTEQSTDGNHH